MATLKNAKEYHIGNVGYRFNPSHRKWNFMHPATPKQPEGFVLITECPGAAQTAHKVAKLINGSFQRTGELNNVTRANIQRCIETVRA